MLEGISGNVIQVLLFLLPGFVCAWIVYGLTSLPIPSQFERIVEALVYTTLINVNVIITKFLLLKIGTYFSLGEWTAKSEVVCSVIIAIVLGVGFARVAEYDSVHRIFRKARITHKNSIQTVFYQEFASKNEYVVLHLKEGERLFGWPDKWPDGGKIDFFSISEASWIVENNVQIDLTNVSNILIPSSEVRYIEFVRPEE